MKITAAIREVAEGLRYLEERMRGMEYMGDRVVAALNELRDEIRAQVRLMEPPPLPVVRPSSKQNDLIAELGEKDDG